ncbi:MAG: acyl-ACP thioesterase [Treponema sp.]|jgi:acyl-ACP thioesterase|nr:acyl-ACP thioesterase [Treponema sp.]
MKCDPANPKAAGAVDVWQETCLVRFGSIDRSDRLTLDAVFQFFQEAAISHAENLGVGREDMARTGQVWILSRISVLVERRPKYSETVTVRSWPRGGEKLFAMRNFDIRDRQDVPVVSARSAWLIVDIEKRRPLRPQSVMNNLPLNEGLEALAPEAGGTAALAERNLQKTAERKALYTDVDYNGHVNNVRYVQWIEDTLDPRLLEEAGKMRLDINYLNEILGGETIEILSSPFEDENCAYAFAFEGRKKEGGQAAFRAELRLSGGVTA